MPLFPSPQALALAAATPVAGYALVNGTGNIITWTAPNDGQQHRVTFFTTLHVSSTETGGVISVNATAPDGTAYSAVQIIAGALSGGVYSANPPRILICEAGATVTVVQSSALTGGAATLWAEIWGS